MTWEAARQAILDSSPESSVYIGCDSIRFRQNGMFHAKYATVVVVHRDSAHGCRIFYDSVTMPDFGGLRQRLMNEVGFAVAAADAIVDVDGNRPLEIHLDLNSDPKHKSNVATKEAVGWVLGMGLKPVIKPDSWAATHAADHCARSKTFSRVNSNS